MGGAILKEVGAFAQKPVQLQNSSKKLQIVVPQLQSSKHSLILRRHSYFNMCKANLRKYNIFSCQYPPNRQDYVCVKSEPEQFIIAEYNEGIQKIGNVYFDKVIFFLTRNESFPILTLKYFFRDPLANLIQ